MGIAQREAHASTESYFALYAGVRRFLDATIAEVRRTAVNSPLQRTAANRIKLAMVRIDREMQRRGGQAAMLL